MYELVKHPIVDAIAGRVLKSIEVWSYQLVFRFDEGTAIVCEQCIHFMQPNSPASIASISEGAQHFARDAPPELFSLLEVPVASASVGNNRKDLVLNFESGHCLTFKGDCDAYECYSINSGGDQLIV